MDSFFLLLILCTCILYHFDFCIGILVVSFFFPVGGFSRQLATSKTAKEEEKEMEFVGRRNTKGWCKNVCACCKLVKP